VGRNFVSGLICTLTSKNFNEKNLKPKTFPPNRGFFQPWSLWLRSAFPKWYLCTDYRKASKINVQFFLTASKHRTIN